MFAIRIYKHDAFIGYLTVCDDQLSSITNNRTSLFGTPNACYDAIASHCNPVFLMDHTFKLERIVV